MKVLLTGTKKRKGFDPDILDTYNEISLLDKCRKERRLNAMVLLLCKEANPNIKNKNGTTTFGMSIYVGCKINFRFCKGK